MGRKRNCDLNVAQFLAADASGLTLVEQDNVLERFSIKCRKTKTKVITLTNHNSRKQSNEPIRARSQYM